MASTSESSPASSCPPGCSCEEIANATAAAVESTKYSIVDHTDAANPKTYEFATKAEMSKKWESILLENPHAKISVKSRGNSIDGFMDMFGEMLEKKIKKLAQKPRHSFWLVVSEDSYGGKSKKLFLNEEDAKKFKLELIATTHGKEDVLIEKIDLYESYKLNDQAIIDALTKNSN